MSRSDDGGVGDKVEVHFPSFDSPNTLLLMASVVEAVRVPRPATPEEVQPTHVVKAEVTKGDNGNDPKSVVVTGYVGGITYTGRGKSKVVANTR